MVDIYLKKLKKKERKKKNYIYLRKNNLNIYIYTIKKNLDFVGGRMDLLYTMIPTAQFYLRFLLLPMYLSVGD